MPNLNAPLSSAADWNFFGGCISGAIHTGWFMTCGHYCSSRFPRSLGSKNLISIWVHFWVVTELRVCFDITVLLWTALCNLTMWPWTSWNRNSHEKLQLATCAFNTWAEACVVAGGDIFESLLKAYVCVNWRDIMKLSYIYTLNLLGSILAFCVVPFILNNPYLLFNVSSNHNSLTVHTYELL